MTEPRITRGPKDVPPGEEALERLLRDEGLAPRWWSNGPGDRYSAHAHGYHKVLYCARGSIVFEAGEATYELSPGDRLDIPPGTVHAARVGPAGVSCVEASRG